jgi:hypothetical protein
MILIPDCDGPKFDTALGFTENAHPAEGHPIDAPNPQVDTPHVPLSLLVTFNM